MVIQLIETDHRVLSGHGVSQVAASGTAMRASAREPARSPQDVVPRDRLQLVTIPAVPIWRSGDSLIFDRKYYEGILLYVASWPGRIKTILSVADAPLPDFGTVEIARSELPFDCAILGPHESVGAEHLAGASLVYASGDSFKQFHVSRLAASLGIKCVYVIEYIPETRYQIAALSTVNPLLRLKRYAYLWFGEQRRRRAFSLASAIHANGIPAYREYGRGKKSLLFFDTRVQQAEMISESELEQRLAELEAKRPLRLAFSGRLIQMKGGDHLITLAAMLDKSGLPFHLTIYGAGELEEEMKRLAGQHGLSEVVTFAGSVDFHARLLPELKKQVDLFICLHRQSDPSCTYLETLSCGVPILGYKNKAFGGLLEAAEIGWGVRPDDLDSIKNEVVRLDQNRAELASKARNSAAFAREHSFETTFRKRIQYLLELCR